MPERDYIREVGPLGDQIRVRFTTRRGRMSVYTAQFEALIEGALRPVVRYDSAHGRPHRDVWDWGGETIEKEWLPDEDFGRALAKAIREIDDQWLELRESSFEEAIMSEQTEFDIEAAKALVSKDLAYTLVFSLAVIEDPTLLEEVPNGVVLVLLPEDDPEYSAISIERGMKAVARGQDVYFRRFPQNDVERRVLEREAPPALARTPVPR